MILLSVILRFADSSFRCFVASQIRRLPIMIFSPLCCVMPGALCLILLSMATDGLAQNRARTVKVLSYNILGGRNTDGKRDLNRIAEVISTLNPDIVALQEVDRHTGRLNGVDLAAELGRLTGMDHVFGRAMKYDGGEYGEAILSKFPIINITNHALPTVPIDSTGGPQQEVEPRAALAVELKFPDTESTFIFIGTHLDHLRDPRNRNIQAKGLLQIAAGYDSVPVILAGDLNSTPESEAMVTLRTHWTDAWSGNKAGGTSPRSNRRIDYVLYTPQSRWKVHRTYRGVDIKKEDPQWQALLKVASDHLPVMAELELME